MTECLMLDFCSYSTAVYPYCYEKDTVIPHCARRSSLWHPECSVCETGYQPSMNGLKCCRGPTRCTRCDIVTGNCTHCYGGFIAVDGLCVRCPNGTWSDGNVSICHRLCCFSFSFSLIFYLLSLTHVLCVWGGHTACMLGEHCAKCDSRTGHCAECMPGYDIARGCNTRSLPLLWWVYALVIPLVGVPLIVGGFVLFYRKYQRHQKDKEQSAIRQHLEKQQEQQQQQEEDGSGKGDITKPLLASDAQ